jgi:hypothetical protein
MCRGASLVVPTADGVAEEIRARNRVSPATPNRDEQ